MKFAESIIQSKKVNNNRVPKQINFISKVNIIFLLPSFATYIFDIKYTFKHTRARIQNNDLFSLNQPNKCLNSAL